MSLCDIIDHNVSVTEYFCALGVSQHPNFILNISDNTQVYLFYLCLLFVVQILSRPSINKSPLILDASY
jgi:hypothetical protein